MKTITKSAVCVAAIGALATVSGAALAQDASQKTLDEITVVAPRMVTRKVVGHSDVGAKIELISLTRHVSYADLNLALHADVTTLHKRIDDIAAESCKQLARMYPLSDPHTPNCIKEAVASAKSQTDKVVADAEKRGA